MIDYGAVVYKNGHRVNEGEFFMDMLSSVGWVDYPRKRYPECDHVGEDGFSLCDSCPNATFKHYSDPELGEWVSIIGDCKGNPISYRDHIDGNYFAYIGDEDLTIAFYKYIYLICSKEKCINDALSNYSYRTDLKSIHLYVDETKTHIDIKNISYRIRHLTMIYKGDRYNVIFGYGIDPSTKTWNKIKYKYLGKRLARKIDRIYSRIEESVV